MTVHCALVRATVEARLVVVHAPTRSKVPVKKVTFQLYLTHCLWVDNLGHNVFYIIKKERLKELLQTQSDCFSTRERKIPRFRARYGRM